MHITDENVAGAGSSPVAVETSVASEGSGVDDGGALTKADIVESLYEQIGLNRREAREITESFLEEISRVLQHGGMVKLSGFGNFEVRHKNERPGRNPKTGEEVPISPRRVVTFRPGHKLKTRVKAYAGRDT